MDNENNINENEIPAADAAPVINPVINAEPAAETPAPVINDSPVIESAPDTETPVAEVATTEEPVAEAPATEAPAAPSDETPKSGETPSSVTEPVVPKAPEPEKGQAFKKLLNKKVIIPVAAVLVVAIVVIICNGAQIANSFRKLFMSSDKYCQYVLEQEMKDVTDAVFERVDNSNPSGNTDYTASVTMQMSEEMIDALDDAYDFEEIDPDIFTEITYSVDVSTYENMYRTVVHLNGVDGFEVISIELIIDADDEVAYLRIPQINETYFEADLDEYFDDAQVEMLGERTEILSQKDSKTLHKLVDKYIEIAISQVTDVDESVEKIKVEGVTQRFTALEIEITEEMAGNMLIAVFDEMLEDDELADFMDENLPEELDYDWDDALDAIEALNDELEDEDFDDDEICTFTLYVNSKGEIKGYEIEADDYYMRAVEIINFNRFAFELTVEEGRNEVSFTGVGSYTWGKINAVFTLESDEIDGLEITLKNGVFTPHKTTGTIIINIEDWIDAMDLDLTRDQEDIFEGMILTIDFKVTTSEYKFSLTAANEDDMSVTVTVDVVTKKNKKKISAPDDTEDDIEDYIDDCDGDDLIDNLVEFGIDEDVAEDIVNEILGD